jgi:hypothetical protein
MSECYHFDNIKFDDGLLNDCVDATYIIHLEGNGRLPDIQKQLEEYHPSNQVFILFNKGYKKCKKADYINAPAIDLIDAFLQCFQHAEENAYNNILILEDDFMFSEKIKEREHRENICEFIKSKEGEPMHYLLGCIPLIKIPYTINCIHYKGISMGTHAVIYNKECRKKIKNSNEIIDWDLFLNLNNTHYYYHIPLCYQLIPETENSKNWNKGNPVLYILGIIVFSFFQLLGLNTSVEPGYSFFYMFSKTIFFLLIITLIYPLPVRKRAICKSKGK